MQEEAVPVEKQKADTAPVPQDEAPAVRKEPAAAPALVPDVMPGQPTAAPEVVPETDSGNFS